MKKSQIAMICGLLVVILGSSASANATLTPIGPFNGLWSESFVIPHGETQSLSIMGGNAKLSINTDYFYIAGGELHSILHSGYMFLSFDAPVDAFGAYMRVDHFAPEDSYDHVRFFDSEKNDLGGFEVRTPLPGLWWYGYESSVPFQIVRFGGSESFWFTMDDLQANPIPEPTTMLLLGSGLIALAGYGRKKLLRN